MDSASRDFAIVIGISRYEHLPVLEGPARDATAFASWLSDPEGGRLDASDIQLLTSEQSNDARFPTLRDVNNAFRPLFEAEPADENRRRRLYVYATGHGFAVQGSVCAVTASDSVFATKSRFAHSVGSCARRCSAISLSSSS